MSKYVLEIHGTVDVTLDVECCEGEAAVLADDYYESYGSFPSLFNDLFMNRHTPPQMLVAVIRKYNESGDILPSDTWEVPFK